MNSSLTAFENMGNGLNKGMDSIIWGRRPLFVTILVINQDGGAPRALPGFDVFPPVADQKTGAEVDPVTLGSLIQEAGLRLTARAMISIVMIADQDILQREGRKHRGINRFYNLSPLGASGHIGLIRHPD